MRSSKPIPTSSRRPPHIDLDLAYYFDDTPGLVRAGFFYKKINNNFTNVNVTAVDDDGVRQRVLDECAPLAESRPDLLALPEDTEFLVNRPTNGEGGKIWGLEFELIRRLDFLPGFLSDFGVLANATYTNGDFPTLVSARSDDNEIIQLSLDRPLRGQARWVYNLSLDYDRDGFQGRVIYTSQSATVDAFDEFNLNTVVPSHDTLDTPSPLESRRALVDLPRRRRPAARRQGRGYPQHHQFAVRRRDRGLQLSAGLSVQWRSYSDHGRPRPLLTEPKNSGPALLTGSRPCLGWTAWIATDARY